MWPSHPSIDAPSGPRGTGETDGLISRVCMALRVLDAGASRWPGSGPPAVGPLRHMHLLVSGKNPGGIEVRGVRLTLDRSKVLIAVGSCSTRRTAPASTAPVDDSRKECPGYLPSDPWTQRGEMDADAPAVTCNLGMLPFVSRSCRRHLKIFRAEPGGFVSCILTTLPIRPRSASLQYESHAHRTSLLHFGQIHQSLQSEADVAIQTLASTKRQRTEA